MWEKSKYTSQKKTSTFPFKLYWRILLAIGSCCLFYYFVSHSGSTEQVAQPIKIKKRKSIKTISKTVPKQKVQICDKKISEEEWRKERREMFSKMSPDEKIEYLYKKMEMMPIPEVPTNRIYATSLEQTMDWVFSCEIGNPPPILPPMSVFDYIHLTEILIRDNPILENDSEKVKNSKETMKLAKQEFIKFIKEGGNPDDFLPYYHGQLVTAHNEWKEARASIYEVVKTEPEIAVEFAKKVNERLASKGIKQVIIPQKMLEAFGIEN